MRPKNLPVPFIQSDDLVGIQVGDNFTMTCEVTVESGLRFSLNWVLPDDEIADGRVKFFETVRDNENNCKFTILRG